MHVHILIFIFVYSCGHMLYVYTVEDLQSECLKCEESNKDYWFYPKI